MRVEKANVCLFHVYLRFTDTNRPWPLSTRRLCAASQRKGTGNKPLRIKKKNTPRQRETLVGETSKSKEKKNPSH